MSWFQYPARRFKGLAGGDYHRVAQGLRRHRQGRHHLRGDGEPRDAALRRTRSSADRCSTPSLWKLAQGMTTRPVKFGTITPELIGTSVGNDYYADQEELIRDISTAMREELLELARRRLLDHSDGRAEHPSGRHPARRRHAAGRRVLRRDLQQHRQGAARPDRGVGPHLLGQSGAAAALRDQPVVQGRAAASEQARRRRADVRVLHERRHGSRSRSAGRSPTRRSRSASSTIATCRWSVPSRSRI